jgi:hypothetical protein
MVDSANAAADALAGKGVKIDHALFRKEKG